LLLLLHFLNPTIQCNVPAGRRVTEKSRLSHSNCGSGRARRSNPGRLRGNLPKFRNVTAWQLLNQLGSEILLRFPFLLGRREAGFDCPIHQSLCGNCHKVCWQRINCVSSLLTQASKLCLNNCLILGNSPPWCGTQQSYRLRHPLYDCVNFCFTRPIFFPLPPHLLQRMPRVFFFPSPNKSHARCCSSSSSKSTAAAKAQSKSSLTPRIGYSIGLSGGGKKKNRSHSTKLFVKRRRKRGE
jgi:hypothetical protein